MNNQPKEAVMPLHVGTHRHVQPGRPPLAPITETPEQRQKRENATRGALVRSGRASRRTEEETNREKREYARATRQRRLGPAEIADLVAAHLHSSANAPRTADAFRELLGLSPRIGGILDGDQRFQHGPPALGRTTYMLTAEAITGAAP